MTEITTVDEVTRDWDWFAVDASGAVGHFTTAGMRKLPSSVKADNEAALRSLDRERVLSRTHAGRVTQQPGLDKKRSRQP
jgi:hypothetical protein